MPSWTVEGDLSPTTLRGDYLEKITGIKDKNFHEDGFLNLLSAGIIAEQFGYTADSSATIKSIPIELTRDKYELMKDTGFPAERIYSDSLIGIFWPNLICGLSDMATKYNDNRMYFINTPMFSLAIAHFILEKHPEYAETYDFVMPYFSELAQRKRKEYGCPHPASFRR